MAIWVTQLRKGILEYAILVLLETEENYALNIVRRLKEYDCFQVSESTVYPILGRLKSEGKLSARIVNSSEGPPRRYLSLTPLGLLQLREMKLHLKDITQSIAKIEKGNKGDSK